MYKSTIVVLLFAGVAVAQNFICPADDGYYPDPKQCDKYYDCYRGNMEEKICIDGLVFDHKQAPRSEKCEYPFMVECPVNSVLQEITSHSVECPRKNGYFEHEDPSNCRDYYECTGGLSVLRACPANLVFDELTGTCQWASAGFRSGCIDTPVILNGFQCPNETQLATNNHVLQHTRHAKLEDCRLFYVCLDGKIPVENGCSVGTVFNDLTLQCDSPLNVVGCENYYPDEQTAPQQLQQVGPGNSRA